MEELIGREIRGYKFLEPIGSGGYGVIYRAEQPSVERKVAIKVIQPELADHPDFARRFETEARTIARLEHPHIVPIHDYWKDDEGAFLVMRLVESGSLRDALNDGPLDLEVVSNLLDQIGAALTVAHKNGVVHRDLKPENILLDEAGNAYLSDFGIAKDLAAQSQTETGTIVGSVDYMAPEQAKAEEVTAQTDIYGLGLILYELLTGQHPFPNVTPIQMIQKQLNELVPGLESSHPEMPRDIDKIIRRATGKNPLDRYENVPAMLSDFGLTLAGEFDPTERIAEFDGSDRVSEKRRERDIQEIPPNPYRGLAAFREGDSSFFYGREDFVDSLLEAVIGKSSLLAIVGSSGSGKSSVVFAGLIPQVRDSGGWMIADFRPTANPIVALSRIMVPMLDPQLSETGQLIEAKKLAKALDGGDLSLLELAEDGIAKSSSSKRLLLVIDQFEELYTLCDDRETRRRFIGLLLDAIPSGRGRHKPKLSMVLTLRADFMGRALAYRPFAERLQNASLMLGPMKRDELGLAIEKPAETQGVALSPGLLNRLLDDVGDEPGNLPLLEFALTLMWEKQRARKLSHIAYDDIGRVGGALARHADDVIAELDDAEQDQARRIFMQLVRPGEGTEDTRRQASRNELGDGNWDLVQHLADRRLVVTGEDTNRQETAEVVHEALIRRWGKLQDWIEHDRAFRSWQDRLRSSIHLWEESDRDAGVLLRGAPLATAQDWLATRDEDLSDAEREFIGASVELDERRRAEKQEQLEQELEAAKEKARAADRLRRGRRYLVGALGVATALAVAAVFFGNQARIAADRNAITAEQSARIAEAALETLDLVDTQRQIALAGELMARSAEFYETEPQLSLLLAVEAVHGAAGLDRSTEVEAEAALYRALTVPTFRGAFRAHESPINTAMFSPDASRILTASDDGTARIWDLTGNLGATLEGGSSPILSAQYSPDGSRIVTSSRDGAVRLWDASGELVKLMSSHPGSLGLVRFSPDGRYIVTASLGGTAALWTEDGELVAPLEVSALPSGVGSTRNPLLVFASFNPDSTQIMLGKVGPDHGSILDLEANSVLDFPEETPMRFSPSGDRILTLRLHAGVHLREADGSLLTTLESSIGGTLDEVWWTDFSPNGSHIVGITLDNDVRLWDGGGNLIGALVHLEDTGRTTSSLDWELNFSPDGQRLLTSGPGGTVMLWDMNGNLLRTIRAESQIVTSAEFSPDGSLILTAGADGTVRLWDADGAVLSSAIGHTDWVNSVSLSPSGDWFVTGSEDQTVRLWNRLGVSTSLLGEFLGSIMSVDISPTGEHIGAATFSGKSYLWDADGNLLTALEGPATIPAVSGLFSPDGLLFLTTSVDRTARLWDLSGALVGVLEGHTANVNSAVFNPDGSRILTTSGDGTSRIWTGDGDFLSVLVGHSGSVLWAEFSPDGKMIVTASSDDTARLWSSEGNLRGVLAGHAGSVLTAHFSPDSSLLVTGSTDGNARIWRADGTRLASLEGHFGRVTHAKFTADGTRVVTADRAGNLRLWDISGQLLYAFEGHPDEIRDLKINPDGSRLFSASADGTVSIWEVLSDIDWMLEEAKRRAGRSLTQEECQKYLHVDECPNPSE